MSYVQSPLPPSHMAGSTLKTLKTRFGEFEFRSGYPVGDALDRLFEAQKFYRAIEVYLTNLMPVSEIATREGFRAFGGEDAAARRDLGRLDGHGDPAGSRLVSDLPFLQPDGSLLRQELEAAGHRESEVRIARW